MKTADDFFDAACQFDVLENYEQANLLYDRALALQPDFVEAHHNRAKNWLELGEYAKALADFHSVIRLLPNYAEAHSDIAWIYLDADDLEIRSVKLALEFAKQSCLLTKFKQHGPVSTLAAAHAAAGDLRLAIRLQKKAVRLASVDPSPDNVFVPYMEQRLAQFENKKNEIDNQQQWHLRFFGWWKSILARPFSK